MEEISGIKRQEVQDFGNLYNTYNQMLRDFHERWKGSNDQYAVQTFKEMLNMKNSLAQQRGQAQQAYNEYAMQLANAKSSQASDSTTATAELEKIAADAAAAYNATEQ